MAVVAAGGGRRAARARLAEPLTPLEGALQLGRRGDGAQLEQLRVLLQRPAMARCAVGGGVCV
jgi:hypothetical protein